MIPPPPDAGEAESDSEKNKEAREAEAASDREGEHGFYAWWPELKGCQSQGDSLEEAVANIREAIDLYVEKPSGVLRRLSGGGTVAVRVNPWDWYTTLSRMRGGSC